MTDKTLPEQLRDLANVVESGLLLAVQDLAEVAGCRSDLGPALVVRDVVRDLRLRGVGSPNRIQALERQLAAQTELALQLQVKLSAEQEVRERETRRAAEKVSELREEIKGLRKRIAQLEADRGQPDEDPVEYIVTATEKLVTSFLQDLGRK